jgi:hypothetical protein
VANVRLYFYIAKGNGEKNEVVPQIVGLCRRGNLLPGFGDFIAGGLGQIRLFRLFVIVSFRMTLLQTTDKQMDEIVSSRMLQFNCFLLWDENTAFVQLTPKPV